MSVKPVNKHQRKLAVITQLCGTDRVDRRGLFDRASDIGLVKWREIYRKFESTINGCKTFANVLEGIAIKYG